MIIAFNVLVQLHHLITRLVVPDLRLEFTACPPGQGKRRVVLCYADEAKLLEIDSLEEVWVYLWELLFSY